MKNSFWVIALAAEIITSAHAAPLNLVVPLNVCGDAKAIQAKSNGCEDNKLFTKAAKDCLGRIDLEAKKLGLDIAALKRKTTQTQKGDLKAAVKEYLDLTRRLDYIIGLSEIARINTFNFIEHVYRPEDEEEDEKENMAVQCLGDNVRAMESIAKSMEKKQLEFVSALELTKKMLLETQDRAENLGNSMGTIQVQESPTAPSAAPKAPKGKNWNASDISGTEDKKKKQ